MQSCGITSCVSISPTLLRECKCALSIIAIPLALFSSGFLLCTSVRFIVSSVPFPPVIHLPPKLISSSLLFLGPVPDFPIQCSLQSTHSHRSPIHSFPISLPISAISLARYVQDPLAEVTNLWSEAFLREGYPAPSIPNELLSLSLHPLQRDIPRSALVRGLRRCLIELVNQVGVDINSMLNRPFLQGPVQVR